MGTFERMAFSSNFSPQPHIILVESSFNLFKEPVAFLSRPGQTYLTNVCLEASPLVESFPLSIVPLDRPFSVNVPVSPVIVAGSRKNISEDLVRHHMRLIYQQWGPFRVVVGGAPGVDRFAETIAQQGNILEKVMKANWETYGKRAGYVRNVEMANVGQGALVVWDGMSLGSAHMIRVAASAHLRLRVVAPFEGLDVLVSGAPSEFNLADLAGVEWYQWDFMT